MPQPGLPRDVLPRLARYVFTPASPRTRRARLDATTASIYWLSVVSGAGGIRTLVPRLLRRAVFSEVVPVPPRRLSVFELEFPRRVRWAARRLPAATSGTTARELKLNVIGRAPSPRSGVICFGSRFRGAPLLFISYSYRSFSPRGGLGVAVTRPGSGWLVWCYATWLFSSSCYRSPFGVAVCGGAL